MSPPGAHAIGGMSGVIPDELDPARTAPMVRKVTVDKRREAGDGFDGTRIGQPAIVDIATAEFDRALSYRANQLEVQRDDVYITASDLLTIHTSRGECTESGLRTAIRTAVHYIGEWLVGIGAVAIDDHLEDTAMAELCRARSGNGATSRSASPTASSSTTHSWTDSSPRNSPSFVSTWASPHGPTAATSEPPNSCGLELARRPHPLLPDRSGRRRLTL